MKITKRQLRRIIKEAGYYHKLPEWHIDGQPWSGSVEDLATIQGTTWGHGTLVDEKGYHAQVNKSRDLARGHDSTPLRGRRVSNLKLNERELRSLVSHLLKSHRYES